MFLTCEKRADGGKESIALSLGAAPSQYILTKESAAGDNAEICALLHPLNFSVHAIINDLYR